MDSFISSYITKCLNLIYSIISFGMKLWLVPLNIVIDWIGLHVLPLFQPAFDFLKNNRHKLVRFSLYSILVIILCLLLSLVNYIVIYSYLVPKVDTEETLYFDFNNHKTVQANTEVAVEFQRNQLYDIYLNLEMPESPKNEDVGMFMVCLDLDNNDKWNPHKLLSVCRPSTLKYRSPIVKSVRSLFLIIPNLLGLTEEKQYISIPMVENLLSKRFYQTLSVSVSILNKNVQIYHSSLSFKAKLSGIVYYIYHYPITTFILGVSTLFIMWTSIVVFLVLSIYLYRYFKYEPDHLVVGEDNLPPFAVYNNNISEKNSNELEKERRKLKSISEEDEELGDREVEDINNNNRPFKFGKLDFDSSSSSGGSTKKDNTFQFKSGLFDDLNNNNSSSNLIITSEKNGIERKFIWESDSSSSSSSGDEQMKKNRTSLQSLSPSKSSSPSPPPPYRGGLSSSKGNDNIKIIQVINEELESQISKLEDIANEMKSPSSKLGLSFPSKLDNSTITSNTPSSSTISSSGGNSSGESVIITPTVEDDNNNDSSTEQEENKQKQQKDVDGEDKEVKTPSPLTYSTNSTLSYTSSSSSSSSPNNNHSSSESYESAYGNLGTLATEDWHIVDPTSDELSKLLDTTKTSSKSGVEEGENDDENVVPSLEGDKKVDNDDNLGSLSGLRKRKVV